MRPDRHRPRPATSDRGQAARGALSGMAKPGQGAGLLRLRLVCRSQHPAEPRAPGGEDAPVGSLERRGNHAAGFGGSTPRKVCRNRLQAGGGWHPPQSGGEETLDTCCLQFDFQGHLPQSRQGATEAAWSTRYLADIFRPTCPNSPQFHRCFIKSTNGGAKFFPP